MIGIIAEIQNSLLAPAAIVCVIVTLFSSVSYLALRHPMWVKLEEAFDAIGKRQRAAFLHEHGNSLISVTATWRLLANLGLLLSVASYVIMAKGGNESESENIAGAMLAGFAISAVVLLIFSVAIPQAWAKYAGTPFLVKAYPVLRLMEWATRPIVIFMHLFDPVVRRLAGLAKEGQNGSLEEKQEQILNVVEERKKEGLVDDEEREMIESVLELRDITVGEIMTPRTEVVGIDANLELAEAVEIILQEGHSRYPVYEESIDKIVGMLYAKDLLKFLNQPEHKRDITQCMRKTYFVPESKKLRDLLHDFQDQKIHLAVVLDEYGGTAGVVTIEDILEELVGEIVDEYEQPQKEPIRQIDENTIEADARVHVDELNDRFGLDIPEDDDYETIGGFAFAKLGHIPLVGETFEHANMRFTIVDVEQRKINRVSITVIEKNKENPDQQ